MEEHSSHPVVQYHEDSQRVIQGARGVSPTQRHSALWDKECDAHDGTEMLPSLTEVEHSNLFQDKERGVKCFTGFQELYDNKQLYDISLLVDGSEFMCHRVMLAASCDYFRAMFTSGLAEKNKDKVEIKDMDAVTMELILQYLYTGQVELRNETVQNLLAAANLFRLPKLLDGCAKFMERQLDSDNCIGVYFFAIAHSCRDLEFAAFETIGDKFNEVTQNQEFLSLSATNVQDIIKYVDIQATEEDVFEAALRWLKHDPESRQSEMVKVFRRVSYALIDEHYFYDNVKSNPLLGRNMEMTKIFDEVIECKLLKHRWNQFDLSLNPRYGEDYCRVILYTSYSDDDKKQVLLVYGQRCEEVASRHGVVVCDLPSDLENPALLVTGDNELILAGGDEDGRAIYKWVPEDNTFESLCNMSVSRKQCCLVQVDGAVFILGGCDDMGNLSSMLRYDLEEECCEKVTPMPKALRCFCAISYKGKLYVFGGECEKMCNKKPGRGKKEISNALYCYDATKDKWSRLSDMNIARCLAGCVVHKDKIYTIGGFTEITNSWLKDKSPESCVNSVEIYDPVVDSWTFGPELPVAMCAMGVVKYYGTIYVLGGESDDDVLRNVYFLNDDNKWEKSKDEMVAGIAETSIHTQYVVLNMDIEID